MTSMQTLPHLDHGLHVTDGGLETVLVFHDGLDLPQFAAFPLLASDEGTARLRAYYADYAEIAVAQGAGLVLESPTWRASPNWAEALGIPLDELDRLNRKAVALLAELRADYADRIASIVISGCVGPEGDGYSPATMLTAEGAERYHARQIGVFADAGVDLVTAITMTYAEEAIGITRAARAGGVPVAISFTVETDGRLPSGQELAAAIAQVDGATDGGPDYYMINCAHPTHFTSVLEPDAPWLDRIRGLRANASAKSHAELDEAVELDDGDPGELAAQHAELAGVLRSIAVLGGCCGTDHRHVGQIVAAWGRA
ncbi:MAG: homocysteine S-methyltransferase family protein [Gaiella sp.]